MLSSLLAGHRQAQAWFNSVSSLLPAALAAQVRAGPLHEAEWTLFANNAAVANKLKHSLPLLLERLRAQGAAIDDIRVKVLAPQDR